MSEVRPWICPHCQHAQSITPDRQRVDHKHIYIDGLAEGPVGLSYTATGCVNPNCMKLTLFVWLQPDRLVNRGGSIHHVALGGPIAMADLTGNGGGKPQPPYIPAPLVQDYIEACRIKNLSPKAAATLVRRCLQGMIRDFCGIARGTLDAEIKALRVAVTEGTAPGGVGHESVDAIDAVRSIGNIGAHMEKDINMIVDVDPEEAQLLIELVEVLFDDWYVARHKRQERFATINRVAADKKAARLNPSSEPTEAVLVADLSGQELGSNNLETIPADGGGREFAAGQSDAPPTSELR